VALDFVLITQAEQDGMRCGVGHPISLAEHPDAVSEPVLEQVLLELLGSW
jgi:hypothetical protein